MGESFLDQVVRQVVEWQRTGAIPELEQARAIVAALRGVGVFEIRVRVEIGHQSHIGGKPVRFDHTRVPATCKVSEAIHRAIETLNDTTSLQVDTDAGIDVDVRRVS